MSAVWGSFDDYLERPYAEAEERQEEYVRFCERHGVSTYWTESTLAFEEDREPDPQRVAHHRLEDLVREDWDPSEPDTVDVRVSLGLLRDLVGVVR